MHNEIIAVLWVDAKLGGMMLSIPCSGVSAAIDTAQEMHEHDVDGTTLLHLRAVRLSPNSDTIETLWTPAA